MDPAVCRIVSLLLHQFILWKYQVNAECQVDSFPVQENFDFTKYVGKWYEQKWLPQSYIPANELFQDYTHYYVLNPNNSVTAFISGRSPENISMCFHYVALLEQTTVPGKFRYTRYWNHSYSDAIDYWVMNTDYDNYAFIYGCEKRNPEGQCTYQDSWVWSRTPTLPASYWTLVNNSMQAVCVNHSRYLDTQQKNECTVDCFVQSFQVQPNFNISKYVGKWYEQKWLPQSYIPANELFQDYTHYYVLNPNNSVTAFISGRSPENISMCFHYVALLEQTTVPGKFRYTRYWNHSYSDAIDYWVMNTDYDNYAFIYGCEKRNPEGQCTYQDSWVWSRTPTLPASYWTLVNNSMQAVCVNHSRYLDTQQKNECTVDCFVQSFQVQPNFNINKYVGKWYEQKWLPQSYIPANELFQDYTHYYVLNPNNSVTAFISGRSPENISMCFYYVALLEQTTVPGKFRYTRYWNHSYSDAIDYWVMNTDYDNYAFIYGCEKRNPEGQCTYQDSWVWSRTPTLPASYWALVNNSMQAVCVNHSRYLDTQQKNECTVDCFVQSFQVQPNFNINKYVGKWYEQKWLPQSYIPANELFQDYTHYYVLNPNNSVTAFISGRSPENISMCFYYVALLEQTTVPGKFRYTRYWNHSYSDAIDYWVMNTDYDNYAFIYGCEKRNPEGQCTYQDSWVWSRTPTLPASYWALVNNSMQAVCVNHSRYLDTQQKNECTVDCFVQSFQVQPNFNINKYVGKWYEQKWLPQSYIPANELFQDYTHYYVLNPNNSVTAFISGRSPENISMCFHYVALLEQTTVPGKFRYTRYWNHSYSDAIDYWVMKTDYDNYAFIYGCEKRNPEGQCTYQDSWVWSRTPTLPASYWTLVNNSMHAVCVNYSKYLDTQQKNDCSTKVANSGQLMMQNIFLIFTLAFLTCGFVACMI